MLAYLHIPFCDSKCSYCAFNSYTHLHRLQKEYMHSIVTQLVYELKAHDVAPKSIETLFIGGGTPSCIEPRLYRPFFTILAPYLRSNAEITSEANPNSATKEWLEGMFALGVTRISFGTQTFNKEKLEFLHRAHTSDDTKIAVQNAKEIGFKNLSIDLIYGTSIDTKELLQKDLEEAFALPIDHLSAYALTIEEGTAFTATPQVALDKEELTEFMFETIEAKGFKQYEISNFGTYESKHNKGYWEYRPYLGIGAGAVGMVDTIRYYPHSDVQAYIDDPLFSIKEELSDEDVLTEKILLGLRSNIGIETKIFSPSQQKRCDLLVEEKKLLLSHKRVFNPNFLLADEIALFLTQ